MKKTRFFTLLICILTFALLFSACDGDEAPVESTENETTVIVEETEPIPQTLKFSEAGKCEFYNLAGDDILVHYISGVYMVTDEEIVMDFHGSVDGKGNIERFKSPRTLTLTYTYENGKLVVKGEEGEILKIK